MGSRCLSLYFFGAFLIALPAIAALLQCPPPSTVLPCTCCDDVDLTITCSGLRDSSLDERGIAKALESVAAHYATEETSVIIDSLYIGYTAVKEVRREMFGGLSFKQIWFNNNVYLCLDRIDNDALLDSQRTLRTFKATIETFGEANADHNHDGSILERFDNFTRLEVLDFMNYKMKVVPNHYYCKYNIPQVRQLLLNVNGIERIDDLAFHHLSNLTMISLLSNRLQRVTPRTFAFDTHSEQQLHVHLWMNEMTDTMFEAGAFSNVRRPMHLDISGNKLTSLPQDVFRDLLASNLSRLSVQGNPLKCDCRLRWLFDDDSHYYKRVEGLACIAEARSIKLTRAEDLGDCSHLDRTVQHDNRWRTVALIAVALLAAMASAVMYFSMYHTCRRAAK